MALGNIFSYSQRILQAIVGYMPTLISSILVLVVGFYAIGWLMRLLNAAMEKKEFDISLQSFVRSLINVVLKVILLITVAGMLGIHTTSFVAVLGAAGLAVGLALQGSLSNFAGGVLILFFKPYKVGDTIEVGGTTGDVLEIQIFNTILKTSDHRTIILPNGSVSNNTIVNHTRIGTVRTAIEVSFPLDSDFEKIKDLFVKSTKTEPRILSDLETSATISHIGNGFATVRLTYFTKNTDKSPVQNNIHAEIIRALALEEEILVYSS